MSAGTTPRDPSDRPPLAVALSRLPERIRSVAARACEIKCPRCRAPAGELCIELPRDPAELIAHDERMHRAWDLMMDDAALEGGQR